jgi:hypothetical protein
LPGAATGELQPFSGSGAFSAIGGLFSTWTTSAAGRVAGGWLSDGPEPPGPLSQAKPPRNAADSPLCRRKISTPDGTGGPAGVGLWLRAQGLEDPAVGLVIGHSGGYPGFSSHMTWHRERDRRRRLRECQLREGRRPGRRVLPGH